MPVQEARCTRRADLERERLAEQLFRIDGGVAAQQIDLELEQLRQAFAAAHRTEQQLVVTQRRVGADDSVHGDYFLLVALLRVNLSFGSEIFRPKMWRSFIANLMATGASMMNCSDQFANTPLIMVLAAESCTLAP